MSDAYHEYGYFPAGQDTRMVRKEKEPSELPSSMVRRPLWTTEMPKEEGKYRLKVGKHEKNFTVKLIKNAPRSLLLIGDDFSAMVFECGGVEKWKRLDA